MAKFLNISGLSVDQLCTDLQNLAHVNFIKECNNGGEKKRFLESKDVKLHSLKVCQGLCKLRIQFWSKVVNMRYNFLW